VAEQLVFVLVDEMGVIVAVSMVSYVAENLAEY
jgi:hypothetical protein